MNVISTLNIAHLALAEHHLTTSRTTVATRLWLEPKLTSLQGRALCTSLQGHFLTSLQGHYLL